MKIIALSVAGPTPDPTKMSAVTSPIDREPEILGQTVVVIGGSVGAGARPG